MEKEKRFIGMEKNQSRKRTTLEKVLYVVAAITALYALFAFFRNWITLKEAYEQQGQSRAENWQQVMMALVNGSGTYILFSLVLYSISSAMAYCRELILGKEEPPAVSVRSEEEQTGGIAEK